jgi:hypothetical protein
MNFERDDVGCEKIKCIQELLKSNAWKMACFRIECKPSFERGWCTAPQKKHLMRTFSFAAKTQEALSASGKYRLLCSF